mmetsp:Transcript_6543/g.16056  ORF Transcript_6543/g.16056 Transcript_6543/m.16056 type:complete len:342 (+) Transcript_6543:768-1793(+)
MSGDALTSVDGRSTAGQSLATVSKWLLGQPRTRVSLELHRILPNGKTDKLQLQIPRGEPRAAAKKKAAGSGGAQGMLSQGLGGVMRPGSFRDAEIPLDDRPIAASQVDAAFARPSDPNVSPPAPLVTPTAGRSRFCGRVWERERWRHVGVESSVCAGRWHAPGRPRSRLRHGPWWSSSRFRWCGTSVGDGRWGVWRRWHGSSFCHGLRTGGGCGHGSGVGDGGAGRGWWSSVCNGRSCRVRQRQGVSDGPTQERRWGKCGSWHRPAVLHRTVPFGTPVSRRRRRRRRFRRNHPRRPPTPEGEEGNWSAWLAVGCGVRELHCVSDSSTREMFRTTLSHIQSM